MMAEYIDKQKFIDKLDDKYSLGDIGRMERDIIVNELRWAETADVQPVVKAEWVYEPYNQLISGAEIVCSHCGERPWWCGVDENVLPPYCPHCGAEMIDIDDTKED